MLLDPFLGTFNFFSANFLKERLWTIRGAAPEPQAAETQLSLIFVQNQHITFKTNFYLN